MKGYLCRAGNASVCGIDVHGNKPFAPIPHINVNGLRRRKDRQEEHEHLRECWAGEKLVFPHALLRSSCDMLGDAHWSKPNARSTGNAGLHDFVIREGWHRLPETDSR